MFFSEEKNQKTFIPGAAPTLPAMSRIVPWAPEAKVFWFFSSEKNILTLLHLRHALIKIDIQPKRLQFLHQNIEALRDARLEIVLLPHDGFVYLRTT